MSLKYSHLKQLNTKKLTTNGLGQAQKYGGVKSGNGISTLPIVFYGFKKQEEFIYGLKNKKNSFIKSFI